MGQPELCYLVLLSHGTRRGWGVTEGCSHAAPHNLSEAEKKDQEGGEEKEPQSKKGKELHVLTSGRCHASVTGSETASLWQSAGGRAPKLTCAPLWVLAVMFWVSPHLLGKDQGCSPGLDEAELMLTVQVSTHWAGDGGQSFPDFCCLAICTVGDLVYCRAFLSFRALSFLHRGAPHVTWTSPWVVCAGCWSRQLCPTGLCNPTELLPQPRVLVKPATM